jgi:hypothetical protein
MRDIDDGCALSAVRSSKLDPHDHWPRLCRPRP